MTAAVAFHYDGGMYFHFSSYLPERKPCSMINAGLAVVYNRKFIIYRRKICITQ